MKKKKAKKKQPAKKVTPKKAARKKVPAKKKVGKKKAKAKRVKARQLTQEEAKQFAKEKSRAREYAANPRRLRDLLKAITEKAMRNKDDLKKIWDGLWALIRLVRAWLTGKYRDVPLKTILLAIAAIIYFLNPFDVIPDFIPVVGYVDDAAVIAYAINSIRGDLDKFLEWEASKK
ncbi:MAG: DUF1232 domain-containing protein [Planctomycetes bacterium]|nr:DUF1232 domain-containing protein [Planctomycetota bacterium]